MHVRMTMNDIIVTRNNDLTQFTVCYLDLIAYELAHLCSVRHMTGNRLNDV